MTETDDTKPATAPAVLRTEIASARRDILQPVFGGLMRPTDDVLIQQGGGKGLKIYEELERDPMVLAVLQKRKLAVIARDWEVEPGGTRRDDKKAADLCRRVLSGEWGLSFDKVTLDLLDATLKGYAVAEVIWGVHDGFFVPAEVAPKDQRRFVFDDDARLRLLTWESPLFGEELPERKFLVHRFGDKTGDPYGRGLGHQLFWWVYFKRMVMQFWLVFAEKFGSPTVAGEYPNTMLPADQDKLLATLSNLAQQGALIMPEGTKAYLLEALRSGTVTYPELVEYCDRMITLAVLGNTLTTSEGNAGSRALGQVHAGVEETIVDADADMLSGTLNAQLMAWITWLNYPGAKPPRVWRPRPTEETAEEKLLQERIKTLDMAVRHVDSRRRSGWEPTDPTLPLIDQVTGDWIYTGKATSVLADGRETMPKDPPAELAAPDRRRDGVDDLVDQVHEAAAPAMDLLVDQVRTIIAEADSLDQVADLLLARYAEIDDTALADVMRQALELGALTGAADAGNP